MMACGRKNYVAALLWMILLWFIVWPIALFCAGFWIILQPFEALFPFIKTISEMLEKIITCEWLNLNLLNLGHFFLFVHHCSCDFCFRAVLFLQGQGKQERPSEIAHQRAQHLSSDKKSCDTVLL